MYEIIIKNYVDNLKKQDILIFANKEGINLNNKEVDILYIYIKKYWRFILKENPYDLFLEIKPHLNDEAYNKMIQLYEKYKKII